MPPYKMQHGPYDPSQGPIAVTIDSHGSVIGNTVNAQNLGITDAIAANGNCCTDIDDSISIDSNIKIPRYDDDIQELADKVRELGNRCAEYESKMQALESEIEMLKSNNSKSFESLKDIKSNTLESLFQDP